MVKRETNFADVVVVGGGIAGLVAAAFAARGAASTGRARRVVLLERSRALGGRGRTETELGYDLNLGPHALYKGGALKAALTELDVVVPGHATLSSGAFGVVDGRLEMLPTGPLSMLSTNLLPLGSKLEVARILARIPREAARARGDQSVREWLDDRATSGPARALLEALFRVTTYNGDLSVLAANIGLAQLESGLSAGVEYLDGGWASLVSRLAERADRLGVELRSHAPVSKISPVSRISPSSPSGGGLEVELSSGERLSAGAVVLATPPEVMLEVLGDHAGPELERAVRGRTRVFAACLDVALSRLPRPKATFALGLTEPTYISVHSAVARLAPEGGAVVHVAKYLGDEPPRDPAAVERELDGLLELLQPGAGAATVLRRYRPRMVVMEGTITKTPPGSRARARVRAAGIEGVFIAGDWVGERHMLADASAASAREAATAVVEHLDGVEIRAA